MKEMPKRPKKTSLSKPLDINGEAPTDYPALRLSPSLSSCFPRPYYAHMSGVAAAAATGDVLACDRSITTERTDEGRKEERNERRKEGRATFPFRIH